MAQEASDTDEAHLKGKSLPSRYQSPVDFCFSGCPKELPLSQDHLHMTFHLNFLFETFFVIFVLFLIFLRHDLAIYM